MIDALERQDSATLILLLNDDERAGRSLFRECQVQFLQWLSRAKDSVPLTGEVEILNRLESRPIQSTDSASMV